MPWATLTDLLNVTSAETLAEAVGDACVTGELLARAIHDDWADLADLTAVPSERDDPTSDKLAAETVTATVAAASRLRHELEAASTIIADGLGSHRPAPGDTVHADILRVRTLDIALYRILRPDDTADAISPVTRQYQAALQWLTTVRRDGLPSADTLALIDAPPRRFTDQTLQDFMGHEA